MEPAIVVESVVRRMGDTKAITGRLTSKAARVLLEALEADANVYPTIQNCKSTGGHTCLRI